MAKAKKKSQREENIARLKKKIAERKAKTGKVLGDAALRVLRKRLKREQRKRRTLAQRLAHAQGKKREPKPVAAAAAAAPEAAAAAAAPEAAAAAAAPEAAAG